MPRSLHGLVLALVPVLALAGCVPPEETPFWHLAGEPGLLYHVKQYYEHNAVEEAGLCPRPLFEGMTRSVVEEDTGERLVVTLGYAYSDFLRDGDDCSRLRPNRCFIMRECTGFNERTFTIAKRPGGFEVIDMSGLRRGRTWQR